VCLWVGYERGGGGKRDAEVDARAVFIVARVVLLVARVVFVVARASVCELLCLLPPIAWFVYVLGCSCMFLLVRLRVCGGRCTYCVYSLHGLCWLVQVWCLLLHVHMFVSRCVCCHQPQRSSICLLVRECFCWFVRVYAEVDARAVFIVARVVFIVARVLFLIAHVSVCRLLCLLQPPTCKC